MPRSMAQLPMPSFSTTPEFAAPACTPPIDWSVLGASTALAAVSVPP